MSASPLTADMRIPWRARGVAESVEWCMRDFRTVFATVPCRKRDVLTVYVLLQYNVAPSGEQPAVTDPATGLPDPDLLLLVTQTQDVYNRWFPTLLGAFDSAEARGKLHKELGDGYARAGRAYDADYAFMSERASGWRHDPFKCMPARLAVWTCLRVLREYLLRQGIANAAAECDDVCAALLQQAYQRPECLAWLRKRHANRRGVLQQVAAAPQPQQPDDAVLAQVAGILLGDLDAGMAVFAAETDAQRTRA